MFLQISFADDGNVTLDEGLASKPREMSLKEFLAYFDFYDENDGATDGMVSKIAVLLSFATMDANSECDTFHTQFLKVFPAYTYMR